MKLLMTLFHLKIMLCEISVVSQSVTQMLIDNHPASSRHACMRVLVLESQQYPASRLRPWTVAFISIFFSPRCPASYSPNTDIESRELSRYSLPYKFTSNVAE